MNLNSFRKLYILIFIIPILLSLKISNEMSIFLQGLFFSIIFMIIYDFYKNKNVLIVEDSENNKFQQILLDNFNKILIFLLGLSVGHIAFSAGSIFNSICFAIAISIILVVNKIEKI